MSAVYARKYLPAKKASIVLTACGVELESGRVNAKDRTQFLTEVASGQHVHPQFVFAGTPRASSLASSLLAEEVKK